MTTYRYNPRLLAEGGDTSLYSTDEDDDGRASGYLVAMHDAPTATPEQEEDFERLEGVVPAGTVGVHPIVFNRPAQPGGLTDEMLLCILLHRTGGLSRKIARIADHTVTGPFEDYVANLEAAIASLAAVSKAAAALATARGKAETTPPAPAANDAGDNPIDGPFSDFLNRAFKAN
jgi:hypothetical protein